MGGTFKKEKNDDVNQSANKCRNTTRVLVEVLCTVLSMTSESRVSDNWLEKERKLQFCYIVISCQKGINCPFSFVLLIVVVNELI